MSNYTRIEQEKVAYALRHLKHQPAALLYTDNGQDETWDLPEICGIPVFHVRDLLHYSSEDCPWLPLYKDDAETDGGRFWRFYADAPTQ